MAGGGVGGATADKCISVGALEAAADISVGAPEAAGDSGEAEELSDS